MGAALGPLAEAAPGGEASAPGRSLPALRVCPRLRVGLSSTAAATAACISRQDLAPHPRAKRGPASPSATGPPKPKIHFFFPKIIFHWKTKSRANEYQSTGADRSKTFDLALVLALPFQNPCFLIKRRLLLGRKVMTNLDSIFKSRDISLPTKVRLVKAIK